MNELITTHQVLIYNSEQKQSVWHDCNIIKNVSATDRDYRVNVMLSNGNEIYGCAPECIIEKNN